MNVLWPSMMLIMNLSSLVIIWAGAHEIQRSAMQVGDMMAYTVCHGNYYGLSDDCHDLVMLPRAMVSTG